jgi:hypothetical protein
VRWTTDDDRGAARRTQALCQKADVPDKSGELLTQAGAQHFIDDLKNKLAERK